MDPSYWAGLTFALSGQRFGLGTLIVAFLAALTLAALGFMLLVAVFEKRR